MGKNSTLDIEDVDKSSENGIFSFFFRLLWMCRRLWRYIYGMEVISDLLRPIRITNSTFKLDSSNDRCRGACVSGPWATSQCVCWRFSFAWSRSFSKWGADIIPVYLPMFSSICPFDCFYQRFTRTHVWKYIIELEYKRLVVDGPKFRH